MTAPCTRTIQTRIQQKILAALIRLARNSTLKACITSGAGQRLLAWFFSRQILTILCDSTDAHPLNVLAFSHERFVQDYQVLGSHSRIRLFTFSFNIVKSILPLFLPTDQGPQRYYYLADDPRVFAGRERLRLFVRCFITHIQRRYHTAGPDHSEEGDYRFDGLGHQHDDAIALFDTHAQQPVGQ